MRHIKALMLIACALTAPGASAQGAFTQFEIEPALQRLFGSGDLDLWQVFNATSGTSSGDFAESPSFDRFVGAVPFPIGRPASVSELQNPIVGMQNGAILDVIDMPIDPLAALPNIEFGPGCLRLMTNTRTIFGEPTTETPGGGFSVTGLVQGSSLVGGAIIQVSRYSATSRITPGGQLVCDSDQNAPPMGNQFTRHELLYPIR